MSENRCRKWDLPVSACAHCRGGVEVLEPDWRTTDPAPLPAAVPVVEEEPVREVRYYRAGVLNDVADVYARLAENLPAVSRGKTSENSAAYVTYRDPRRAPLRVEVADLMGRIEREVPDLARWVCDACEWVRCLSTTVDAGLETLAHYWPLLTAHAPETAAAIEERLRRLVHRGERLLGETPAPIPLESRCPSCGQRSLFRVFEDDGYHAVCTNPEDAVDGRRRRWTETEWEDRHGTDRRVAAG